MARLKPTLPSGVEMQPFYDQSNIVQESIGSVRDAIVIGLVLAGLIIWLFLRDWGTAVMTGLVVPVTMVVTFIAMKVLGQTFNLMTLGGLAAAVWLVIDDKIVVVENIVLIAMEARARCRRRPAPSRNSPSRSSARRSHRASSFCRSSQLPGSRRRSSPRWRSR